MGGRTLPHYCKHGVPVDGGDFLDSVDCKDCKLTLFRNVYKTVREKNMELETKLADAEDELIRYREGYKGSCYACETVGEKNVELQTKLATAEADAARYLKALTAIDEQLSETEGCGEIDVLMGKIARAAIDAARQKEQP